MDTRRSATWAPTGQRGAAIYRPESGTTRPLRASRAPRRVILPQGGQEWNTATRKWTRRTVVQRAATAVYQEPRCTPAVHAMAASKSCFNPLRSRGTRRIRPIARIIGVSSRATRRVPNSCGAEAYDENDGRDWEQNHYAQKNKARG
jgi:hypothetical protein